MNRRNAHCSNVQWRCRAEICPGSPHEVCWCAVLPIAEKDREAARPHPMAAFVAATNLTHPSIRTYATCPRPRPLRALAHPGYSPCCRPCRRAVHRAAAQHHPRRWGAHPQAPQAPEDRLPQREVHRRAGPAGACRHATPRPLKPPLPHGQLLCVLLALHPTAEPHGFLHLPRPQCRHVRGQVVAQRLLGRFGG
jgi:hypothetical protein